MAPRLTPTHRRALLWLPADGSWAVRPPRSIAPAITSLGYYHGSLVEQEWGKFGPLGGGWYRRCRLTFAGIDARKEIDTGSDA